MLMTLKDKVEYAPAKQAARMFISMTCRTAYFHDYCVNSFLSIPLDRYEIITLK